MQSRTHTLELDVPKDRVFDFLSNIENLPKWATQFCLELKLDKNGRHKITTPDGEIFFRIESDPDTGVIDMFGGPSEGQMMHWPARVVGNPSNGSIFVFTAMQYPGIPDEVFAAQCDALRAEFEHIRLLLSRA